MCFYLRGGRIINRCSDAVDRHGFAEAQPDEQSVEDLTQLPSTMPDIGVDLYGFASEDKAKAVGEAINGWCRCWRRVRRRRLTRA
jgi:hypothetical protein